MPVIDCPSYYKTLRECYEKYGNEMFSLNVMKGFLYGYDINEYMGITVDDIKRDLEKIARGEPDSNLSSPSADSLINLIESWNKHENLMEITDLNSYYRALREYHAKYGKSMLKLDVIVRFLHTYQLDKKLNKSARDIQKDLETIISGDELPDENLPIYKTKRWREIKSDFPNIYDAKSYLDTLEYFYFEYFNHMFDKDVINEFIRTYQLDTKFQIGYKDVIKDLHKMDKQLKAEIAEERAKKNRWLRWETMECENRIIGDYESYKEVLKQYYLEYGKNINTVDFVNYYKLKSRFNIDFMDVGKDLDELEKTGNIISKQPHSERTQTINTTPPVSKQSKKDQATSDSVLDKGKILDEYVLIRKSNENDNHRSYIELLKQYYKKYGDEMFLLSKLGEFRKDCISKNIPIRSYDIVEDLRKIRKPTDDKFEIYDNYGVTTPPVQEQSRQNQNASNTLAEHNESFYSYVTHMSNTQLINMIDGQYKAIKDTWTLAPCMGTYGSIEFAAVLLLWKYAVNNFNRNQKAYASLQVTLGDMIGCSFFGMPAKEWSDKIDPIINTHADILSYEEFGDVYNYLKDKLMDKIHSMEFNKGNTKEAEYRQIYEEFTRMYNSVDGFPEIFDFYTSKGLNLETDIQSLNESAIASLISQKWEWGEKDFMQAVFAFLSSQKWRLCSKDLVEDTFVDIPSKLTDNFYSSSYSCPTCGKHMYKTVFPKGAESPIKVDKEVVLMKRIFTCPTCHTFYTPLSGHKLSYGQCYCLESRTQYDLLLKIFDRQGTTDGRPDA